jgi:hypothetical protein
LKPRSHKDHEAGAARSSVRFVFFVALWFKNECDRRSTGAVSPDYQLLLQSFDEASSLMVLAMSSARETSRSSISMSDRLLDILMGVFELVVFFAVAVAMIVVSREFWIP